MIDLEKQAKAMLAEIQAEEVRLKTSITEFINQKTTLIGENNALEARKLKFQEEVKQEQETLENTRKNKEREIGHLKEQVDKEASLLEKTKKENQQSISIFNGIKNASKQEIDTLSCEISTLNTKKKELMLETKALKEFKDNIDKEIIESRKKHDTECQKKEGLISIKQQHLKNVAEQLRIAKTEIETIHGQDLQHILLNYDWI